MNKIILADNQAIFRTGAAKILSMEEDCRIIAQCPDDARLQAALGMYRGTIVVFGSTMKHNPSELMQKLFAIGSKGIAILETSEWTQPYLAAHVHGLLFRSITGPTLVECVRRVGCGERAIQCTANPALITAADQVGTRVRDRLTPKEKKIIFLITKGCKNKEIGFQLGTTEQVVKNYLRNIYDKIGVHDRLELAVFTMNHRVLAEAVAAVSQ